MRCTLVYRLLIIGSILKFKISEDYYVEKDKTFLYKIMRMKCTHSDMDTSLSLFSYKYRRFFLQICTLKGSVESLKSFWCLIDMGI